jgi:hypothetical protein
MLVDKCLQGFLKLYVWADCVRKWGNKLRTARTFLFTRNTLICSNGSSPVCQHFFCPISYDFAATLYGVFDFQLIGIYRIHICVNLIVEI